MANFKQLGREGVTNIDMIVSMTEGRRVLRDMKEESRQKIAEHIKDTTQEYMSQAGIQEMSQLKPADAKKILDASFRKALEDRTIDADTVQRLQESLQTRV